MLFPGIGLAAKKFGVSRVTIWRALDGGPDPKKLAKRYRAFFRQLQRNGAAK